MVCFGGGAIASLAAAPDSASAAAAFDASLTAQSRASRLAQSLLRRGAISASTATRFGWAATRSRAAGALSDAGLRRSCAAAAARPGCGGAAAAIAAAAARAGLILGATAVGQNGRCNDFGFRRRILGRGRLRGHHHFGENRRDAGDGERRRNLQFKGFRCRRGGGLSGDRRKRCGRPPASAWLATEHPIPARPIAASAAGSLPTGALLS